MILDDKSGFDWETDWLLVNNIMRYEFPEGYLDNPEKYATPPQWRDVKSFETETIEQIHGDIDPHSKFSEHTHSKLSKEPLKKSYKDFYLDSKKNKTDQN